MNKFIKTCPKCGEQQSYSCKSSLTSAIQKNTICNICIWLTRKIVPENGVWKRICKCGNEMIYSCRKSFKLGNRKNSICRNCATKESSRKRDHSWMRNKEYRNKMRDSILKIRNTDRYGEQFKEKCRQNKAKQIVLGLGNKPNYNKNACIFIDKLNFQFGWKLKHAESGGEEMIEGFFVDGYDNEYNIVFEYDEPKHHTLSQEKRDQLKEKIIIDKLNPTKFVRYSERYDFLYDIINEEVLCPPQ